MNTTFKSDSLLNEENENRIKNGRLYILSGIIVHMLAHIATKIFSFLVGKFHIYELLGSIVTIITLYYLWRGSKYAYGFILFCFSLATLFTIYILINGQLYFGFVITVYLVMASFLLLNSSSRLFLSNQAFAKGSGGI